MIIDSNVNSQLHTTEVPFHISMASYFVQYRIVFEKIGLNLKLKKNQFDVVLVTLSFDMRRLGRLFIEKISLQSFANKTRLVHRKGSI